MGNMCSQPFKTKPTGASSSHSVTPSFQYTPLEDNCIRLVHVQPRRKKGRRDKIECTLTHVTFREKPHYDALSYAWGDYNAKKTILLNGIEFKVGENLAAALVNIRGLESAGEGPRKLWIDAICINQSDIAERNRQVRHMPYIYARAQMVLIWLGTRSAFEVHFAEEDNHDSDLAKHHGTIGVHHRPIEHRKVEDLCRRDYWKRLWIIQEIGKAKYLRIYYDSTTTEWDRFIENVKQHRKLANSIPLKFESQLRGPRGAGLTLSNLLRANRHALCRDPRDKIYGLLGLAIDVDHKFPIDYSKSLFQVFKDVIFLQNSDETRSQHDILEISQLVGRTLGGPMGLEPDEPARNFNAGDISLGSALSNNQRLRVPGRLAGRIKQIGPFHSDMIARIEKSDEWRALIMHNFKNFNLRSAVLEQSDRFLQALEHFDEISQRTVFAFDHQVKWKDLQQYSVDSLERNFGSNIDGIGSQQEESLLDGCRLFLLQPPSFEHTVSCVGLAPRGTRVGDFVCQIAGIERAVIVRQSIDMNPTSDTSHYFYEIIGCVGLARISDTAGGPINVSTSPSAPFDVGKLSGPIELEHFNLYMDIYTANEISC